MDSRPDRAFRIADRRKQIFDGTGAFLKGARWNSPGRRVIYAAGTFAGAILEVLVHTAIGRVPRTHAWVEITIPSEVSVELLHASALPGWETAESDTARRYGDEWHQQRRSLILVVPSAAASGQERNVLINQDHPEFEMLRVSPPRDVVWDNRLFRA